MNNNPPFNINEIILDHEDFVKIKLYQSCMLLDADSTAWLKIRSALSAKYKFTVDLDTFSETLGVGVRVLPSRSAIWQKSSSVVELFVRYDFEHEQDAAVREMLIHGLTERNRIEFNPSLTISYVSHRFASLVPPNILGIIRLNVKEMPIEEIKNIITTWDYINKNVYQMKLSYDSYHDFLEKQ
jgi:hypothetical protein